MAGQVQVTGVLIGEIKDIPAEDVLPPDASSGNRLIQVAIRNHRAKYYYNEQFQLVLIQKISNFIKSELSYEGMLTLYHNINRIRQEFVTLHRTVWDYLENEKANLYKSIAYYETMQAEGVRKLHEIDNAKSEQTFKIYLEKMVSGILLTIFSKSTKLWNLRVTKMYEKEKVNELFTAKKFSEGGLEILSLLYMQRTIIEEGYLSKMINDYNEHCRIFEEIEAFISIVNEKGNYLKTDHTQEEQASHASQIQLHTSQLLQFFEHFSSLYQRLIVINIDLKFTPKRISNILKIWDCRNKMEQDLAAKKYIEAEIKYIDKQMEKCLLTYTIYESKSKAETLTGCLHGLNESIASSDNAIQSVTLTGNAWINNTTHTGHNFCGCTYQYTSSSVSHNFSVSPTIRPIENLRNPHNFIMHQKSKRATEDLARLGGDRSNSVAELSLYNDHYAEYESNIKESEDHLHSKKGEIENENFKLSTLLKFYNDLVYRLEHHTFSINSGLLVAWLGLLFSNSSIVMNGASGDMDKKDFSAVNLDPNLLYKILFNVLRNKDKIMKGKCEVASDVRKVHTCDLIQFEDLQETLLNPRVYGCLKNDSGESQSLKDICEVKKFGNLCSRW